VIFKIVFVLAALLEFVFVPLFLKASWPEKCWKSLGYKMICSSLFIAAALCCIFMGKGFTEYAKYIFIGLLCGALGDLLIHFVTDKAIINVMGGVAFLIGHIFFIIAFIRELLKLNPSEKPISISSLIVAAVFVIVYFTFIKVKKIKIGILTVPVIIYAFTIITMLISAVRFTAALSVTAAFLTALLGAILFVCSDSTLAVFTFGGERFRKKWLKNFYIITYFTAQFLIGASVIFIG